ncbi:MAG: light-harvesting protein [Hyphomicrobium sp.]|jgi:light-harvesting protein B-800-850 alpha chain|nr:light-harvesting protein [Hyphomicrobium sp.]PPD09087.1 MAG: light-harvesting protein [Hyphomicrobium sp.]
MNQGRIWCVVQPTVGLPLFLGSVAVTSLIVHAAVLNNTTYMGDYWSGKSITAASVTPAKGTSPVVLRTDDGKAAFAINVTPAAGDSSSFVIKVDRLPGELALADPGSTVK